MKSISQLYFTFCFLLSCAVNAQVNLIQNGSFEVLDSCPNLNWPPSSSIHYAHGWDNACDPEVNDNYSSPDLFNRCTSDIMGVPSNWFGFQEPYEGDGYAGLIINFYPQANIGVRDFIQNTLNKKIIANCKYKISFQFSYASAISSYKTDALYFIFSNNRISIPNNESIINSTFFNYNEDSVTVLRFPELLEADTTNWWYFEREFYSNAPANYVTIGSISDSVNTNNEFGWVTPFTGIQGNCRGYFDDIRLIQLDTTCVDVTGGLEVKEREYFSIYPNPAKGSLTISIPNNEEEMLVEFIDVSGRIVKAINLNPIKLQILDVSDLSAGWYAVGVTRPISGRDVKPIFIEN